MTRMISNCRRLAVVLTTAGLLPTAALAHPGSGIVVDRLGQIYFVDTGSGLWRIDAHGALTRIPGGRSRLEGVIVSDVNGSINSQTEIGNYHRTHLAIRNTAAGSELCFDVGGKSQCAQAERDLATNDLLLYDATRPRGHADLRLHRVHSGQKRTHTE